MLLQGKVLKGDDGFTASIESLGIITEGDTLDELKENLEDAVEAISFDRPFEFNINNVNGKNFDLEVTGKLHNFFSFVLAQLKSGSDLSNKAIARNAGDKSSTAVDRIMRPDGTCSIESFEKYLNAIGSAKKAVLKLVI